MMQESLPKKKNKKIKKAEIRKRKKRVKIYWPFLFLEYYF